MQRVTSWCGVGWWEVWGRGGLGFRVQGSGFRVAGGVGLGFKGLESPARNCFRDFKGSEFLGQPDAKILCAPNRG